MTLGRKIILRNIALLLGLGTLAATAMWGLLALRQQVATVSSETSEEKHFLTIGLEFSQAKTALAGGDYTGAQDSLRTTMDDLRGYGVSDAPRLKAMREDQPEYFAWDRKVRDDLSGIAYGVSNDAGEIAKGKKAADPNLPARIDQALRRLQTAVQECQGFITAAQESADRVLQITLILVGSMSALILLWAAQLSRWHYESVMGPLERLRRWVRQAGGGRFPPPLELSGDLEFCELTVDVNQMARELHEFYHRLDEKVQQTSRELVRSQRLASVGFLAAGVAHEINNPLNIMSGYAELTLSRLERGYDPAALQEAQRALQIIQEEAFRCKQITAKLLSTARGGGDTRELFSLRQLTREVAAMTSGLRALSDRQLELHFDEAEPLEVFANRSEMKQVVLNLTINALEAVKPGKGRVEVDGRRDGEWVELIVRDNGRGMEAETLERIFEPFFTEKRGAGEPGTGLGLCIAHAIVENHGGKIVAASGGLDRGSIFTIRLPAKRGIESRMPAASSSAESVTATAEAR